MSKKGRVFKYTRFSRFASKENITDQELLKVVDKLEDNQADANLGWRRIQSTNSPTGRREIGRTPRYSVL